MSNTDCHTPLPWRRDGSRIVADVPGFHPTPEHPKFVVVNNTYLSPDMEERHANAAFIVRAVNSHEELVEALQKLTRVFTVGTLSDPRADAARNELRTYAPEIIAYVEEAESALQKAGVTL